MGNGGEVAVVCYHAHIAERARVYFQHFSCTYSHTIRCAVASCTKFIYIAKK